MKKTFSCWIEAMRLRTLPVSLAGIIYTAGLGLLAWHFRLGPWLLCLVFALLAQIASNFANEYFDFKGGLDRKGREGPRRGVTEGDIPPRAMLTATLLTLGLACIAGIVLVAVYGEWWMYIIGVLVALGVMAYSTGPYPLSHHGFGEVAVVIFFGVVPVCLTYILMGGEFAWWLMAASVGIGLMGANVLIVNNYRDREDDQAVGKRTLAVKLGLRPMLWIYVANGFLAAILTFPEWLAVSSIGTAFPLIYLMLHGTLSVLLARRHGKGLNPLLGMTAMLMLIYAVTFVILSIVG